LTWPVSVFYGWIVVAVAFLTMGVGVTVTRGFSLLFPPILDELGWAFEKPCSLRHVPQVRYYLPEEEVGYGQGRYAQSLAGNGSA
jgi:hypothetical protein